MTELEQYGLIKELDEFSEWMRDSAPRYDVELYQSLEEQIKDLEHESGDFYDVFVDIQLNTGKCITICNRAFETLVRNLYRGDDLFVQEIDSKNGGPKLIVHVHYQDPKNGFTQMIIPVSSICYFSGYTKKVKWQERWDALSKDKKDDCIAAFNEQCKNRHQGK